MASDHADKLIADLVADLTPVRRLAPVSVRMLKWLTLALFATAAAIWVIGLRTDLSPASATAAVLVPVGLALATLAAAALAALRLSVPGADRPLWLRWLAIVLAAAWAVALVFFARASGVPWPSLMREPFHAACIVRVIAIATLPTIFLAREVRRGFALDSRSAITLAALGGAALAALAVQFVCPIDRAAHLLMSHVVPMLGLVTIAAAAARVMTPSRR